MRRRTLLAGGVPFALAGCLQLEEELEGGGGGGGGGDDGGSGDDSGGAGDDGGSDDPGSDDDGGDDDELTFPTGLDEDGVSAAIAGTHRNALMRSGGTVEVRRDELTHEHDAFTVQAHIDGQAALADIDWHYDQRLEAYFASTDGGYWRGTTGSGETYGRDRPANRSDIGRGIRNDEVRTTIHAADWTAPTVDEENRRFLIEADGVDDATQLAGRLSTGSIESLTAEGVVDENGIIREVEVEYEHLHEGRVLVNTLFVTTENVGDPPSTEPEWLDEAMAEAPDIDATAVEDRSYIELIHGGGNPIPADTDLVLHGEEDLGRAHLAEPIESGDVLYLYVEDGGAHASRGSPPEDASPDTLEPRVAVWAHRGMEYFFTQV